jgi:hypothetical protein
MDISDPERNVESEDERERYKAETKLEAKNKKKERAASLFRTSLQPENLLRSASNDPRC